jgi:hypothetical protein
MKHATSGQTSGSRAEPRRQSPSNESWIESTARRFAPMSLRNKTLARLNGRLVTLWAIRGRHPARELTKMRPQPFACVQRCAPAFDRNLPFFPELRIKGSF